MAIVNGYCTEADLQRNLKRTVGSGDANYTLIQDCITRASRKIDEATGTFYYTQSIDEYLDCFEQSDTGFYVADSLVKIFAPAPIISITSITEDGVTLVSGTDYYLYKNSGVLERNGTNWSVNRQAIRIVGSIGYSSTPPQVTSWCLAIAEALTGLATTSVTDDNGNQMEIQKSSIPKWVFKEMFAARRQRI